jgi:hypothetical protein
MSTTTATHDLEDTLGVGDIAYDVRDSMLEVIAIGDVTSPGGTVHRVAVLQYLRGEFPRGTVVTHFAGDLLPETRAETDARWAADPDSIGQWPAFKRA